VMEMRASRGYRLELTQDEDSNWVVRVPDLPGVVASGRSLAVAMRRLPDAIDSWIEAAEEEGAHVPPPQQGDAEFSGRFVVRLLRSLHRRLAERADLEGVSLNALCQALLAAGLERYSAQQFIVAPSVGTVHMVRYAAPASNLFSFSSPGNWFHEESEEYVVEAGGTSLAIRDKLETLRGVQR
jgi:antitoxin HicB